MFKRTINAVPVSTSRSSGFFTRLATDAVTDTTEAIGEVLGSASNAFGRGSARAELNSNLADKRFADEAYATCRANGMSDSEANLYVNALLDKHMS